MMVPELVVDFMDRLQMQGICFAMDDFGAGFTALRYFKEFCFDVIKIDGQFINGIARDADGRPADDGRGPTFTLEPRDLGKEVRVRVGYRRNGYATMTQKTAAAAVKAVSTIGSTTRVTGRDVKVAVRVRAAGVATPRGTVVVRVGGASRRLTLVEGRAVTTFRSVSRGKHAVAVEYRGSSITRSATATAPSVTVR